MKLVNYSVPLALALIVFSLTACANKEISNQDVEEKSSQSAAEAAEKQAAVIPRPAQLPVRFQTPSYIAPQNDTQESLTAEEGEFQLKVGATIRSTAGPQPLWDIISRLASLKGMSVSWASDVNRDLLVDVNISPEDNFSDAIENLLRQLDYFHEIKNNTIIIKYKESRIFHLALPYMKGTYNSTVGGDFLPTGETGNTTATQGTAQITSPDNQFDVWKNIRENLDLILQQEYAQVADSPSADQAQNQNDAEADADDNVQRSSLRRTAEDPYYFIDQAAGLITITAPKSMLDKFDVYFRTLKKELYRQVVIEAKIVEVFLQDNSKIGLDWTNVLKDFDVTGTTYFGGSPENPEDGTIYPWSSEVDPATGNPYTRFISKIALNPANFSVLLNALNEQGDANVLSNPKVTVLNGQPSIISIARNITYIKKVTRDETDNSSGTRITFTPEPGQVSEGVALGVVASIIDDDTVILHLTPITTDLENGEVEERQFPDGSIIGLPIVNVREMSTMVQVDNGEMLIIGGLIDKIEGSEGKFAPVVGSIPLVRYLFGYEEKVMEKRELVILLSPRII